MLSKDLDLVIGRVVRYEYTGDMVVPLPVEKVVGSREKKNLKNHKNHFRSRCSGAALYCK